MAFDDDLEKLINRTEDDNLDDLISVVKKSYNDMENLTTSQNAKIDNISKELESRINELSEVKSKNYDLLMKMGSDDKKPAPPPNNPITIDDLFKPKNKE